MKHGRRTFLRGAGGFTVAAPFLSSLAPKAASAATDVPRRFITFWSSQSPFSVDGYFPQVGGASGETLERGVLRHSLSALSGPVSRDFGSSFERYRDKANFYRHLDPTTRQGHNYSIALGGYGEPSNGFERYIDRVMPHRTIDHIIGDHIYPTEPYGPRVLNLSATNNPRDESRIPVHSFVDGIDGVQKAVPFTDPRLAFDTLFAGLTPTTPGSPPQDRTRERDLLVVDRVIDDYRSLRNGGRASNADIALLEGHMAMLFDVESRIRERGAAPVGQCGVPAAPSQEDPNHYFRAHEILDDMIRMAVAAVHCDLTRVINVHVQVERVEQFLPVSTYYHGLAHSLQEQGLNAVSDWQLEKFVSLLDGLEDFQDPQGDGGSYLDSSIVMNVKEMARGSDPGHSSSCQPVMTVGSGCGAIRTGLALNYSTGEPQPGGGGDPLRTRSYAGFYGWSYSHFLVTMLYAMGLTPEQWEAETGEWVGDTNRVSSGNGTYMGDRREVLPGVLA